MSLHCFFIPARQPEPAQDELNAFLVAHRVLAVQREWLTDGAHSGWAFCVEVSAAQGPLPPALKVDSGGRGARTAEVDYKQVLDPDDFAAYARLRALRKQLAQTDGVPLYAVGSNGQLAALVTQQVRSLEAMAAIEGMGPARVNKYGPAASADAAFPPPPVVACGGTRSGTNIGDGAFMIGRWMLLDEKRLLRACRARRVVDQPSRQRALGLPQQEAPRQPEPEPGLPGFPKLPRSARRWWCAPPWWRRDQSQCPVPWVFRLRANRKGPGVLVGRGGARTLPGCSRSGGVCR